MHDRSMKNNLLNAQGHAVAILRNAIDRIVYEGGLNRESVISIGPLTRAIAHIERNAA